MKGLANGFYRFSEWAMRLAYLNFLWITFTLMGLVVFGFMPATAGMFAVTRKWVEGYDEVPIFQTFWKSYRKEFLKINVLGYILAIIGYLLTIEFSVLRSQAGVIYFIASFGVIAQFILYAIVVMYFFQIFVHFNLKPVQYLKWPFVIGIIHPIMTVILGAAVIVIYSVTFRTIPGLIFFFGGSVTSYILMWGAYKTFSKYERAEI